MLYHFGMNRIREFRERLELTQQALAELIDTSQAQIDRLEKKQDGDLKVDWLNRLANALGCQPWDLVWEDARSDIMDVPISGYVGAGDEIIPIDNLAESEHAETVPAPTALGNVAAVRVRGSSMRPIYQEGDIIFYRPTNGPLAHLAGRECVVRLGDGHMYLKKLHKGPGKSFILNSYNADPIANPAIEWAGPVLWVRRDEKNRKQTRATDPV